MRLLNMYDNESDVPGGCPSIGPPHIYIYIYIYMYVMQRQATEIGILVRKRPQMKMPGW
jgi:hypothetical protein